MKRYARNITGRSRVSRSLLLHDTNGNLQTDHLGRSFSYDAENVLRTVTGLTGGNASYRYHADGTRREKSHNGSTRTYYHMGGLGYLDAGDTAFAADQEIAEYAAGMLLKRFIRLPGSIDEAFLMIDVPTGTQTWAHTDRLGSVIATTDSTGTVNNTYRYSPYGKPGSEGAGGYPFRFTGQQLDAETGLYYYKARYYDPEVGRFLQTDPIGYDDQMNLYAYVGNDPVNKFDPLGLCETEIGSKLCKRGSKKGNGNTERDYIDLAANNSEYRQELYDRLRSEAERLVGEYGGRSEQSLSEDDLDKLFTTDFDKWIMQADVDTLERFAVQLETISFANKAGEVVEVGGRQLTPRVVRAIWRIFTGSKKAYEKYQYSQEDVDGWIGQCVPSGGENGGHCGFYDPNNLFYDVNELVPGPMKAH